MLDVALALVPRTLEDIGMIGIGQVRRQQCDRGQRERTSGQQLQDNRKAPRGPRSLDPSVCGVLRVMLLSALCEAGGRNQRRL
jgi:hypothetical protein